MNTAVYSDDHNFHITSKLGIAFSNFKWWTCYYYGWIEFIKTKLA